MEVRRQVIASCAAFLRGPAGVALCAMPRMPVALLLAFSILLPLSHGAEAPAPEAPHPLPEFVFQPLYASNQGSVYGVYEARHADLVLVEGGFDSGFQTGMICRVLDGEGDVGEVMLVEVRNNCAAALILQLDAGRIIQPGHSVRIKTVTF